MTTLNITLIFPSPLPEIPLQLSTNDTIASLIARTKLPPQAIILYHKGTALLKSNKTLQEYNIKDTDHITINWRHGFAYLGDQIKGQQAQAPGASSEQSYESQKQQELNQMLQGLDPDSVEYQAKLEEAIRKQNIDTQWANAMEYSPELYGTVSMLYIPLIINGKPVKAFVDSGAQISLISASYAETLGITRLIDERRKGQFRGVGTANQVGMIHAIDVKFGSVHLTCQLRVMENSKEGKGMDFLLGLDMLKRHQACIDLEQNVLRIHGAALPFLSESEIPKEEMPPVEEIRPPVVADRLATTTNENPVIAHSNEESSRSQDANSDENKITTLQEMAGITQEQAREMLAAAGGNIELALNLLMG